MSARIAAACACLLALSIAGCSAASRHRILTRFFDGVPPPKAATAEAGGQGSAGASAEPGHGAGRTGHGPYEAKLCDACHARDVSNTLVAPRERLCLRCHAVREETARYPHGPAASGACLSCHDPHGSRYAALLVGDPDSLCLRCHDRELVATIEGHGDLQGGCATCHNPHGSETKYLLR